MPRNVEIKAKIDNFDNFIQRVTSLSGDNGSVLEQQDFFYNCATGRLKLRSCTENGVNRSQLIFYTRPDSNGPKLSSFIVTPVQELKTMDDILTSTMGRKGIVTKQRTLFMIGQTRVHVDKVERLGNYMELEVMLRVDQSPEDGAKVANDLMRKLEISESQLVVGAYMDLINARE
uniref:Uncharacterized LOC100182215 n=1 Tax=Ciona intestinalis TaxID=7719 RepID=F6RS06_CIOIN|nr:uncharacterized protein LOC100182215 [Ciona intestinalis]|eukprot:XP_002127902.1 uncharacterized protein LOC100182215 [Ciona intestinalis]